jgi:hypothetical protein
MEGVGGGFGDYMIEGLDAGIASRAIKEGKQQPRQIWGLHIQPPFHEREPARLPNSLRHGWSCKLPFTTDLPT